MSKNKVERTKDSWSSSASFTRDVLGIPIYHWQEKIHKCFDKPNQRVAVKVCNGGGKTSNIVAPLVLWYAMIYPGSCIIITSAAYRNIKNQVFPNIRMQAGKLPNWEVLSDQATYTYYDEVEKKEFQSRIIGFATSEAGKFEGWHNDNATGGKLLIVVDESKTVADEIFEAIERCQPDDILMVSSPGVPKGAFFSAFQPADKLFKKFTANAFDCPHIVNKKVRDSEDNEVPWIQSMKEKFGESHPLYRSMVLAEFMDEEGEQYVIPLKVLNDLYMNFPRVAAGDIVAFCDFAGGGDENVFALRIGNRITELVCWRDDNTEAMIARFLYLFHKFNLKPGQVFGDAAGMGQAILDQFEARGFFVIGVNNGSAAEEKQYMNLGTEIWAEGSRKIQNKEIILPDDEKLKTQLSRRKAYLLSTGKVMVEPKHEMQESPDRADAVLGAMYCREEGAIYNDGVIDIIGIQGNYSPSNSHNKAGY